MQFDKTADGYTPGFNDPFWTSTCGKYRITRMQVMQRESFRLLKAYHVKGYPWIGAGSGGYNSRQEAQLAANVFHLCLRRKSYSPQQVVDSMFKRLGATPEQIVAVLLQLDNTARTREELLT